MGSFLPNSFVGKFSQGPFFMKIIAPGENMFRCGTPFWCLSSSNLRMVFSLFWPGQKNCSVEWNVY